MTFRVSLVPEPTIPGMFQIIPSTHCIPGCIVKNLMYECSNGYLVKVFTKEKVKIWIHCRERWAHFPFGYYCQENGLFFRNSDKILTCTFSKGRKHSRKIAKDYVAN